nr:MAG TPA: hypothetical protein [Caudoviricetes sp.]
MIIIFYMMYLSYDKYSWCYSYITSPLRSIFAFDERARST